MEEKTDKNVLAIIPFHIVRIVKSELHGENYFETSTDCFDKKEFKAGDKEKTLKVIDEFAGILGFKISAIEPIEPKEKQL